MPTKKIFNRLQSCRVDGNGDNSKAIAGHFRLQLVERGHLVGARRTPSGPEIYEHDLSPKHAKIDDLPTRIGEWRQLHFLEGAQVRELRTVAVHRRPIARRRRAGLKQKQCKYGACETPDWVMRTTGR